MAHASRIVCVGTVARKSRIISDSRTAEIGRRTRVQAKCAGNRQLCRLPHRLLINKPSAVPTSTANLTDKPGWQSKRMTRFLSRIVSAAPTSLRNDATHPSPSRTDLSDPWNPVVTSRQRRQSCSSSARRAALRVAGEHGTSAGWRAGPQRDHGRRLCSAASAYANSRSEIPVLAGETGLPPALRRALRPKRVRPGRLPPGPACACAPRYRASGCRGIRGARSRAASRSRRRQRTCPRPGGRR